MSPNPLPIDPIRAYDVDHVEQDTVIQSGEPLHGSDYRPRSDVSVLRITCCVAPESPPILIEAHGPTDKGFAISDQPFAAGALSVQDVHLAHPGPWRLRHDNAGPVTIRMLVLEELTLIA